MAEILEQLLMTDDDLSTLELTNSLRNTADTLLATIKERQENYCKAVVQLKLQYESIIEKAKTEAQEILDSAHKQKEELIEKCNASIQDKVTEIKEWGLEKEKLSHIQKFSSRIKLDVGGVRFTTSAATLTRFPDTMIGAMFSGRHILPLDQDDYIFIDRDGTHFRHILNFLRSPEGFRLELDDFSLYDLKQEAEYYGLKQLMFPFVPVTPITVTLAHPFPGITWRISQDNSGFWRANDEALMICKSCGTAWRHSNKEYLRKFNTGRQIILEHLRPIGSGCPVCR